MRRTAVRQGLQRALRLQSGGMDIAAGMGRAQGGGDPKGESEERADAMESVLEAYERNLELGRSQRNKAACAVCVVYIAWAILVWCAWPSPMRNPYAAALYVLARFYSEPPLLVRRYPLAAWQ